MSLPVAIALGVASAAVYGGSAVVQHRVASRTAEHGAGQARASGAGLLAILRNPLFLLAMCGDGVGFALQIAALSTGEVVFVQPLVMLLLPIALLVSYAWGGPRPRPADVLGCAAVLGGIAGFLTLIGRPPSAQVPNGTVVTTVVLAVTATGGLVVLGVRTRAAALRSATYGAVAGCFFGLLAAFVDAGSTLVNDAGLGSSVTTFRGLALLVGILLLGGAAIALTQMSFQVGQLGAALPASLLADALAGILFGAVLLHEAIPVSPARVFGYAAFVAASCAGAIRLADPTAAPAPARNTEPDPADRPSL